MQILWDFRFNPLRTQGIAMTINLLTVLYLVVKTVKM
jgi:hypothetical protein